MALKSPVPFHHHWGEVADDTELPNKAGATIQDAAVEVGDTVWVTDKEAMYQCTTATVGSAVWDSIFDDPNAIHDDQAGEINALTVKGTPTVSDVVLIEDVADSNSKAKSTIQNLPTALDANAIHVDTAAEISPLTEKTALVDADTMLIEDSEASYAKKYIEVVDMPRPQVANLWQRPATAHSEDDEFDSSTIDSAWEVYNHVDDVVGSLSSGVDAYDTTFNSGYVIRANAHEATRRSWMLLQAPGPGNVEYYTVAKQMTIPTNLLAMARMKFSQRHSVDDDQEHVVGLGFFQDSGTHADWANSVLSLLSSRSATEERALAYKRVSDSGSDVTNTTDVDEQGQALEYVAIHKIGTTYHCWVGTAAGNWIYMGAKTHATTMGYVGFLIANKSTTAPGPLVVGVDFIRFLETDDFLF